MPMTSFMHIMVIKTCRYKKLVTFVPAYGFKVGQVAIRCNLLCIIHLACWYMELDISYGLPSVSKLDYITLIGGI